MSSHKTQFTLSEAKVFLSEYYSSKIEEVERVSSGEESQAFYFDFNQENYVLRVSSHGDLEYLKDKVASDEFGSIELPIPEVLNVGKVADGISFVISRRAKGKTLNNFSKDEVAKMVPEIVKAVSALHRLDPPGEGYGGWGLNGRGRFNNWQEYIKACFEQDEEEVKFSTFYDNYFQAKLKQKLMRILDFYPEKRSVLHNDLGPLNMISDGVKLNAIIDWGDSMYGDPLKDVACLNFWFEEQDFVSAFRTYYQDNGGVPDNFEERVSLYMILIGYGSLWFYAYSNQEESYWKCRARLEEILKKT